MKNHKKKKSQSGMKNLAQALMDSRKDMQDAVMKLNKKPKKRKK